MAVTRHRDARSTGAAADVEATGGVDAMTDAISIAS